MTVRALWETQNVIDCIPDEMWDKHYGGSPLWQHLYHLLHSLDQWFINPRANDFVEPPVHVPDLQDLDIYPAAHLDRGQMDAYFYTIKAKLSLYLTAGLPVVIWEQAAEAAFVRKHGLGICVASLRDLKEAFDKDYISKFGKTILKWNK